MLTLSRFSRYFLVVAKAGSLRKAAELLNVSASAIDRQILLAESELETELFERLPNGLKLTAAGELLLNDVKHWQKEYTRTLERFDELKNMRRGHVTIGLIDALSDGQLPVTIAAMAEQYPGLSFDLRVVQNRHVQRLIQSADVDFGLLLDPAEQINMDMRALATIPMGMVMPVGHALSQETSLALGQTLAYKHIIAAEPLLIHDRVARLYARHQVNERYHFVCNNVQTIRSLILQNAGIGVLSWLDVAADVQAGRLAFVPLHERQIKPLTLYLCIAAKRQLSKAAQMAIQHISDDMKKLHPKCVVPSSLT